MKTAILVLALSVSMWCPAEAQAPKALRIAFAGSTTLTSRFSESIKLAGPDVGLSFEVVPFANQDRDYLIAVTQVSGIAHAAIAVDRRGEVVASVAHAGRLAARGASEASARELARKLAELAR